MIACIILCLLYLILVVLLLRVTRNAIIALQAYCEITNDNSKVLILGGSLALAAAGGFGIFCALSGIVFAITGINDNSIFPILVRRSFESGMVYLLLVYYTASCRRKYQSVTDDKR